MTDAAPPPRRTPRFLVTRIALLGILAGLWTVTVFEWDTIAYRRSDRGRGPVPDMTVALLTPRLPFLDPQDVVVAGGEIIWRRPSVDEALVLTPALGEDREPVVRLFVPRDGEPGHTIGYAVRRAHGWHWLTEEETLRLEEAARLRELPRRVPVPVGETAGKAKRPSLQSDD